MMVNDQHRGKIQQHQAVAVRNCCRSVNGKVLYRNGIVTLPCGSGKTIVGVCLMAMAQARTLIVVQTMEQQSQWVRTLLRWTYLKDKDIFAWTSGCISETQSKASVVVLTYARLVATWNTKMNDNRRATDLLSKKYGLLLLDEVHHLPAPENRKAL